jgi:hypothetical protein
MVYLSSDNIITSLGTETNQILNSLDKGVTGITDYTTYSSLTKAPVSTIDLEQVRTELQNHFQGKPFTRFESIALLSLLKVIQQ